MVQRQSEPMQPSAAPQLQVGQSGVGQAQTKNKQGMFSTHVANQPQNIVEAIHPSSNQLLQNILGKVGKTVEILIDNQRQQAYLDGALAVGAGIQEDNLDTHPLTRAWKVAGHRDYSAKMATMEYEASITKDLAEDRMKTPTVYAQELSARRSKLIPVIEGMSAKGREESFNHLLTLERSAITNHASEHAKFVVGQEMLRYNTELGVGIETMLATQPGTESRQASSEAVFAKLYNLNHSSGLGLEDKSKLTTQAVQYALAQGDFSLYEQLMFQGFDDGAGNILPLANNLTFEDRTKLAKSYETAKNTHRAERGAAYFETQNMLKMQMAAGESVDMGFNEYRAFQQDALYRKLITPEAMESNMTAFVKYAAEDRDKGRVAQLSLSNDQAGLIAMGVTPTKAAEVVFQNMVKQRGTTSAIAFMYDHGATSGQVEYFEVAGKYAERAISALAIAPVDGELDPDSITTLALLKSVIDEPGTYMNKTSKQSAILKTMSDDNSTFLLHVLSEVGENSTDFPQAVNRVKQRMADKEIGRGSFYNAAQKAEYDKVGSELISNIYDTKRWFNISWLNPLRSAYNRNMDAVRHRNKFWTDTSMVAAYEQQAVVKALSDGLERYETSGKPANMGAVQSMLAADLANQAHMTDHGLVIMPHRADLNTLFDIPSGYTAKPMLEKALSSIYKPSSHTSLSTIRYTEDGVFEFMEFEKDTNSPKQVVTYTNEEVGQRIKELIDNEVFDQNVTDGAGLKFPPDAEHQITVNGRTNTAMQISKDWIVQTRLDILQHEGISPTAYPDSGGIAIGVGMNQKSTQFKKFFPDGKVPDGYVMSQDEMDRAFQMTTDEWMGYVANSLDLRVPQPDKFFSLLANLSYQGGYMLTHQKVGQEFMKAALAGDVTEAVKKLKDTPSYKSAGATRKAWYEQQLRLSLSQGN